MKRRPTATTLLTLFILIIAGWNGLRLVEAVIFHSILNEYHVEPGSLYIGISGGFWFLAGLIIFLGLWLGKTWARFGTIFGIVGYAAWYWFDRLILQKPHSNWPFALVVTIILVTIPTILLLSQRTRQAFSKASND